MCNTVNILGRGAQIPEIEYYSNTYKACGFMQQVITGTFHSSAVAG